MKNKSSEICICGHEMSLKKDTYALTKDSRDTTESFVLLCPNCRTELKKTVSLKMLGG